MSNEKVKIVLRDLLLLFILVAFMALPIAIAEEVPAHVVISEVFYDESGADNNEFCELYNPTDSDIDISGWKLKAFNQAGVLQTTTTLPAGTTITAHKFYLIGEKDPLNSADWGGTAISPDCLRGGTDWQNGPDDYLVLEDGTGTYVDGVRWGHADSNNPPAIADVPDNHTAPDAAEGESIERKSLNGGYAPAQDTDDNSIDFSVQGTPTPKNSASPKMDPAPVELFDAVGNFKGGFAKIQDAVNAASDGYTILVHDGTYTENVNVNKRLTIRSENGAASTIVQVASLTDHVFEITADYVNISGFNVTGATGGDEAGIYLGYANHSNVSDNTASNNWAGIGLVVSSNNTITSNIASANNKYGIGLSLSNYNNIMDNTASNNTVGIGLDHSNYNSITDNTASKNTEEGIGLEDSIYNTITSNTVSANADCGIALYSSHYNFITNNAASNNEYGIGLSSSDYNNISDNTATNNDCGIGLKEQSSYNNITSNTASANNQYGIGLSVSDYNNITSNTASNNWAGIGLSWSNYNNISDNTASNNYYGIGLEHSIYNNISGNTANSNNGLGIYLYSSSSNNLIYNNYFDNTHNANDNGNNEWNTTKTAGTNIIGGPYLGGNYWSDYAGKDTDGDGLGDTLLPYSSSGNITTGGDWHPLTTEGYAPPNITSFAPHSPVNDKVCNWRRFNVTVNQTVNVSWYRNNSFLFTNESVREANYTLHATIAGEHNVSAVATNANGMDMQTWVWNVTAAPAPAPPNITSFAPPSPVNDTVCNWRTFNVTVNQTVNVSWYLNGSHLFTNDSVTEANYTLHAQFVGDNNVSAVATNANGTDMQTWIWNVTAAPVFGAPNITSFAPPSPVNDTVCNWRTFNVTVNQTVNVSWYRNNSFLFKNESVREANCTLHAQYVGENNVSAVAWNANGTDMQQYRLQYPYLK
jgi:parallel beta-helix repeat protein